MNFKFQSVLPSFLKQLWTKMDVFNTQTAEPKIFVHNFSNSYLRFEIEHKICVEVIRKVVYAFQENNNGAHFLKIGTVKKILLIIFL